MLSKHPTTELCLPMLTVLNNRQTFLMSISFIFLPPLYQVSNFSACLPTLVIFCPFWIFQARVCLCSLGWNSPWRPVFLSIAFPLAVGWRSHCDLVWVFLLAKVSSIVSEAYPLSVFLLWRCACADLCWFLIWVVCLYYWIGKELGIL